MKRTLPALLVLLLLVPSVSAQVLDALVARVETEVVTWSEVYQEMQLRALTEGNGTLPDPRVVTEALVRVALLVAEAEKLRLDVEPGAVEAELKRLVSAGGEHFWERVKAIDLTKDDLRERARRLVLVRQYLQLRREMTFVPESQVRAFYASQLDVFGGKPLAEVRDEVREYLAEKKYQKELGEWMERQLAEGRVELLTPPGVGNP